jgi:spermidine/putrescine-binding protein
MQKTLIALLLTFPFSLASADEIKFYNWEEYLDEEVIAAFTEETGHTVKQYYFDDEGQRDATLASGRGKGFDLVLMDSMTLRLMSEQGLFQDISSIGNELQSVLNSEHVEACGSGGIPYTWGTMGILYRESVSKEPIHSWSQLFNPPEEHKGRVVMYLDAIDTNAAALLALNTDPLTEDIEELKKAYALLEQQKSSILEYGATYSYASEHGDESRMSMALGYTGEEYNLEEATGQDDWTYVVPDEGTLTWIECLAIPSDTAITNSTRAFIEYINRPEIAARNAESIWVSTSNQAALPQTNEEYRSDLTLFPTSEILKNSHDYKILSPRGQSIRERMIDALR